MSRPKPVPRARGTAVFLAAGCLLLVALLSVVFLGGDPRVNLLALLMTWSVGVLMLVGGALYLIGGRRVVRVRRVILLCTGLPALAVIVAALIP